jgi:S-DNA-T family DNA segregation ATPase FtsK/SpoIIIE
MVTEFISEQRGFGGAFILPEAPGEDSQNGDDYSLEDRDELFSEAARIVVETQQGSTSMIQRKLKIGYNRAGRLIDQLEIAGIVGAGKGSKARDVKIPDVESLERYLDTLP